jgi:hypothetical protein
MSNRSANATIKGYFYQFDHSIIQILSATSRDAAVLVEGIEDIDLVDGDDSVFIQCKYYEGTEYNHSVIKDAIIHMLRHFHNHGCKPSQKLKYRIYGHYQSGQDKLPSKVDLDFLKNKFLTYTEKKVTHVVHNELKITNAQLNTFLCLLNIDVRAKSYDDQQREVEKILVSQINGCQKEDAQTFYYPMAINTIQNLAIQKNEANRRITKKQFLDAVNKKEAVFSLWLRQKFGEEYYARSIKKKYFPSLTTKIQKSTRIFILDASGEFDLAKISTLLGKIGNKFSHVEHQRTPVEDRFCPYILLRGVTSDELIEIKSALLNSGIKLADGHVFHGAPFSPTDLVTPPTKENLIKLKFIPSTQQIGAVSTAIKGMSVEIFEFFKDASITDIQVASTVQHHKIKTDSVYFLNKVI